MTHEQELIAFGAWWSGALSQWDAKTFPTMAKILGREDSESRGQTPEEAVDAVRRLKVMLKGSNDG